MLWALLKSNSSKAIISIILHLCVVRQLASSIDGVFGGCPDCGRDIEIHTLTEEPSQICLTSRVVRSSVLIQRALIHLINVDLVVNQLVLSKVVVVSCAVGILVDTVICVEPRFCGVILGLTILIIIAH
jgi:hypothetical protein